MALFCLDTYIFCYSTQLGQLHKLFHAHFISSWTTFAANAQKRKEKKASTGKYSLARSCCLVSQSSSTCGVCVCVRRSDAWAISKKTLERDRRRVGRRTLHVGSRRAYHTEHTGVRQPRSFPLLGASWASPRVSRLSLSLSVCGVGGCGAVVFQ